MVHERVRHLLLGKWARLVCDHAGWALLICIVVAGLAGWVTVERLRFQADRNDLIARDLPWNQRYIEFRRNFHGQQSVIVVVERGETPEQHAAAEQFVQTVAERLKSDAGIRRVWHGFDPQQTSGALLRLLPMPQFEQRLGQMGLARPLLEAGNMSELIETVTRRLAAPGGSEPVMDAASGGALIATLGQLIDFTTSAIRGEPNAAALEQLSVAAAGGWQYLPSEDGALMFIDVEPKPQQGVMNPQKAAVEATRRIVDEVKREMPGVSAGLTGMPVIEADETAVSMSDSTITSVAALIAIASLLVFSFHSFRLPLLMVLALAIGIVWSYGYLTVAVGHLQVLSVVFTVILLGLGIDFSIHIVSRFELVRHDYGEGLAGFRDAMEDSMQSVGPGLITGALMTAIAFGTTLFTDFTGMAEMGHIAAVGLMLCLLATLSALPALMRLLKPNLRHVKPPGERKIDLHEGAWLMPVSRHPYVAVIIAAVVVGVAAIAMTQVRYDNNLKQLLPSELDSLQWLQKIEAHKVPIWSAASITDSLEEAERRIRAFRQKDAVADVSGIGLLFPQDEAEKLALIRQARQQLGPALERLDAAEGDTPGSLGQRLATLRIALGLAIQRPDVRGEPEIRAALVDLLGKVQAANEAMVDPAFTAAAAVRVEALNETFRGWKQRMVSQLSEALSVRPLRPDDLPEYLRLQAVSVTEPTRYVIKVNPAGDVWQPERMAPFIEQVREVDPLITGSPVQIYESGLLMQQSYQLAGALALAVVFLLAFLDFRSVVDALLCLLPVTAGFITTLGVMWLADVSINPANVMVLPLLFGIGVASGIHIMHRYKQERYARPLGLSEGTVKAIILTSMTTIIAFASMLLAQHRGIKSLGFVLSVGITLTLIASLLLMPAVLELRNRYHVMKRYRQWKKASSRDTS